jgi:hypothetical protein
MFAMGVCRAQQMEEVEVCRLTDCLRLEHAPDNGKSEM